MSRNVKNVKASAPIQKYCKVCHDAGKSEAEYRSHFTRETRDPNSKVTCPTLLALECRYCYKNGHTVKYCPVLKDNEKQRNREEASTRRTEAIQKAEVKPKGKSTNKNVFAALESDSEDDVVAKKPVEVKEEYPMLCAPSLTRTQSVSTNYAAALSNPAPPNPAPPKPAPSKPIVMASPAPVPIVSKPLTKPAPWASTMPKASEIDWAAWSDSEADDDDDYDAVAPLPSVYKSQISYYPSSAADDDDAW